MSKEIIFFTDGSALGNPGRGGWAYLMIDKKNSLVKENGGSSPHATNNQMELKAFLESLKEIDDFTEEKEIVIYLDSEYVKNGITSWIHGWKKNGWRTAAKKPVLNKDLWIEIDEAYSAVITKQKLELKYVPGHSGVAGNEIVDTIARTLAAGEVYILYTGDKTNFELQKNIKL